MKNSRFFLLIEFSDEALLPGFLELAGKAFGKYDYFTQNIKCYGVNLSTQESYGKLRLFSFTKTVNPLKIGKYLKKTEKIKKKLRDDGFTFTLSCGYVNQQQVVTFSGESSCNGIVLGKNLYATLQMFRRNSTWYDTDSENNFFKIRDVRIFFTDVARTYRDKYFL